MKPGQRNETSQSPSSHSLSQSNDHPTEFRKRFNSHGSNAAGAAKLFYFDYSMIPDKVKILTEKRFSTSFHISLPKIGLINLFSMQEMCVVN